MKITYHNSACVAIEDQDVKILCDPWLINGEFYGSWAIYPPYDFKSSEFEDIDYIYISHIHPDHFSIQTLSSLNKKIPILIHKFHSSFLKNNIEKLGYEVIEIEHNKRINLKGNIFINILAADNCNPEICSKVFGCGLAEKTFGSTSIDTMCVIDNNEQVIVNTNDCPFEIGQNAAQLIKNHYKNIDFLFVGYSSAGPYPQCFRYDEKAMKSKKQDVIKKFLLQTESYLNLFKPKFYMPFAGKYVLSGKNWKLNSQRAIPEIDDAVNYLQSSTNINQKNSKCVLLNQKSNFDISTSEKSEPYLSVNANDKSSYIESVLSKIKYSFEEIEVGMEEILKLVPKCYQRFEFKRKSMEFTTNTIVLILIENEKFLAIPFDGSGWRLISKNQIKDYSKYVIMTLDKRLLYQLLKGPKFAHWNNAEIGSHIFYERKPDIYERGLYYCINFFHE